MSKKLTQLFFHSEAETLLLLPRSSKLCNLIWERDEISSRCSMYYYYSVCNSSMYLMVGSRNAKHYQQFGSKTRTKKEDGKVVHSAKVNADTKSLQ